MTTDTPVPDRLSDEEIATLRRDYIEDHDCRAHAQCVMGSMDCTHIERLILTLDDARRQAETNRRTMVELSKGDPEAAEVVLCRIADKLDDWPEKVEMAVDALIELRDDDAKTIEHLAAELEALRAARPFDVEKAAEAIAAIKQHAAGYCGEGSTPTCWATVREWAEELHRLIGGKS